MNDLVSIIIPIYNTEKYLEKCVQSVISQTYTNLEIILVDDGSPDNCGKLCDEFTHIDSRIKVIHKENGGLSSARNSGLRIAAGKYIAFCDSDDWMEEYIINKAVSKIKENDSQIVIWGYSSDLMDSDGKLVDSHLCKIDKTIDTLNVNCFVNNSIMGLLGYAWNKLYNKTTILDNSIEFREGTSLVEDVLFNAQIISHCKNIAIINEIGTHYMQRDAATLGNAFYPNFGELIGQSLEAQELIMDHFDVSIDKKNEIASKQSIIAIKYGIFQIIDDNSTLLADKYRRLKQIINSSEIQELAKKCRTVQARDRFLLLLVKRRMNIMILCCSVFHRFIQSPVRNKKRNGI